MEETPPLRPKNLWLLNYVNPLTERLGADFFRALPRTPGVYRFYGRAGDLLYVGKAKSLRERVNSYRHAKPESVSRKVLRMIQLAVRIEIEELPDETAALLRENQLLRELKPPFNRVNTSPESYPFIAIRVLHDLRSSGVHEVRFRFTTNPSKQGGDEQIYGVFRSKRLTGNALLALLRCLWLIQNQRERFAAPQRLSGPRPPLVFSLPVEPETLTQIRAFLLGRNKKLLETLSFSLLTRESLPRFLYTQIESDLLVLKDFYEGPATLNQRLRQTFGLRTRVIKQEEIDDMRVKSSSHEVDPI